MNKKLLVMGHIIVTMGIFFTIFLGMPRVGEIKSQQKFMFGTYSTYEPKTNKTYRGAGTAYFYDCYGDRIEVVDVHPPQNFTGSLGNFYFFIWEPEPGPSGTSPNKISELGYYHPSHCANENTVYFELVSDETGEFGWDWAVDFVRYHISEGNNFLLILGIIILGIGITVNMIGLSHRSD